MLPVFPLGKKRISIEFKTLDLLFISFLLLLTGLEIVFHPRIESWHTLVLKNILVLSGFLLSLWIVQNLLAKRVQSFARIAISVGLISFVYNQMGEIIHILFPYWWDDWINRLELSIFGVYPTVWMQSFAQPWITEMMMAAYVIYGLLLPGVALFSYQRGREEGSERFLTEVVLAYFICYVGYILIPVAGPSRALVSFHAVPLEGYFFTGIAEYLISDVHLIGGAFPSAHCAAVVVMLAAVYRHSRVGSYGFLLFILLIDISTVYGRFHYVADVVAGTLVAVLTLWAAPKLQARVRSKLLLIPPLNR